MSKFLPTQFKLPSNDSVQEKIVTISYTNKQYRCFLIILFNIIEHFDLEWLSYFYPLVALCNYLQHSVNYPSVFTLTVFAIVKIQFCLTHSLDFSSFLPLIFKLYHSSTHFKFINTDACDHDQMNTRSLHSKRKL